MSRLYIERYSFVSDTDALDKTLSNLKSKSLTISLKSPRKQNIPVDISANVTKIKQFEAEWSVFSKDIESEFILSALTSSPMSSEELKSSLAREWSRLDGTNVLSLMQQWYDENKYSFLFS